MDAHNEKISGPLLGLGVFILLTMGSLLLPASWFGIESAKKTYSRVDLSDLNLGDVANDRDADGSISWKELVTDSLSPEEIARLENQKPDAKVIADLNDQNNLTASFSKNLYAASAYLAKNQLNDPLAEQETLNQLMFLEAQKMLPRTYQLNDLNIATSEDKDSIRKYGNSIASILPNIISEESLSGDVTSIQTYVETQDAKALEYIQGDAERVTLRLKELENLPVPLSAATSHVLLLDRVSLYRDIIHNLSRAEEDPIRSALSIKKHPEAMANVLRMYSQFSTYFDGRGIVFNSQEPGYVFTVGYTFK